VLSPKRQGLAEHVVVCGGDALGFVLPHGAIPVPKFESGAVSFLVFDAHFWGKADILRGGVNVR
jgi:hypothetical protein